MLFADFFEVENGTYIYAYVQWIIKYDQQLKCVLVCCGCQL